MNPDKLSYEEMILVKRELSRLNQMREEIHSSQSPYLALLNSQIELLLNALEISESESL